MTESQHSNPLYGAYARLPAPVRRAVAALVPGSSRARVRYWARGEMNIIDSELRRLDGTPWHDFRSGLSTAGTTERVVEYPWVLSRYAGERRVLDVGTANAIPAYLSGLRALKVPELHGVDLSPSAVEGVEMTQADIRHMPFPDGHFDLVFCVSTLEHVGCDNTGYGIEGESETDGDVQALVELRRVVRDGGRILVTVPFGQRKHYGWFKQYDLASWQNTVAQANLRPNEVVAYGYGSHGWSRAADPHALESADYRAMGALAATAVLCSALRR